MMVTLGAVVSGKEMVKVVDGERVILYEDMIPFSWAGGRMVTRIAEYDNAISTGGETPAGARRKNKVNNTLQL